MNWREVTPVLVLKWAGVAFVISLWVLMILVIVLTIVDAYS